MWPADISCFVASVYKVGGQKKRPFSLLLQSRIGNHLKIADRCHDNYEGKTHFPLFGERLKNKQSIISRTVGCL